MPRYASKERKYIEDTFNWLHNHPEVGLETIETGIFVAESLRSFGYEVIQNVGGHGVIGIWDTGLTGPLFALRADMDALLFEVNGEHIAYHACGHDAHSTILLTTAKILKEKDLVKKGKLVLIFQPSEEDFRGAMSMINTGLLDDIEELIGIHITPKGVLSVGEACPAVYLGACTTLVAKITGMNAHASTPHLGINASEIASLLVSAVNCIHMDPNIPHSCKVTTIKTSTSSHNVIPDKATLYWDIRTQTNALSDELQTKIKTVITAICKAFGAKVEIKTHGSLASLHNDDTIELAKEVITELLGEAAPSRIESASDDFNYYSNELGIKTTYINIGAKASPNLHVYGMEFDHKAMEIGTDIFIGCTVKRLG
ncbi:MAG: amidohydrolase [Clostridiales bacterium]|nr:amidohydrolase [Clostridiales bacterium]